MRNLLSSSACDAKHKELTSNNKQQRHTTTEERKRNKKLRKDKNIKEGLPRREVRVSVLAAVCPMLYRHSRIRQNINTGAHIRKRTITKHTSNTLTKNNALETSKKNKQKTNKDTPKRGDLFRQRGCIFLRSSYGTFRPHYHSCLFFVGGAAFALQL